MVGMLTVSISVYSSTVLPPGDGCNGENQCVARVAVESRCRFAAGRCMGVMPLHRVHVGLG